MALMKCPECKESISDKASFCPHCGYPINENTTETPYEIAKGSPVSSGLSIFLMVLALITWIGGLIISISGANISVQGYYRNYTEFSFTAFLTLFIPYIIYGSLLIGMSTLVQHITDTYNMIDGLKLVKKTIQNNQPFKSADRSASPASVSSSEATGLEKKSSRFIICPKCGIKIDPSYFNRSKTCPACGYDFAQELGSNFTEKDTSQNGSDFSGTGGY